MNKNIPGFRTDSVYEHESFDPFLGLDKIKRNIKKLNDRVGLGKVDVPTVTGSTATTKIDSLISALAMLGLITDETT